MAPNPNPRSQPNEDWSFDFELDPEYQWRIEQLERAGFDHFPAFRIAVNDCDWRQAIHMLTDLGASQEQVLEILL